MGGNRRLGARRAAARAERKALRVATSERRSLRARFRSSRGSIPKTTAAGDSPVMAWGQTRWTRQAVATASSTARVVRRRQDVGEPVQLRQVLEQGGDEGCPSIGGGEGRGGRSGSLVVDEGDFQPTAEVVHHD
eukprot:Polyplicarium_translucidae@DN3360_c0_g1_i13.p4